MIDCDILIAGSGIAGLTAALTAVRVGRSTMVLTGATLGGQLLSINKIDGYPGFPDGVPGYDLCPIAQEQATAAGAVLKTRCNYSERRLRSITLIPTHSSRAWVSHTSV